MRYFVRHLTRFRYTDPVHESLMEVRMAPRTEGSQRCVQFRLQSQPGAQMLRYEDHYGNVVYHFGVPAAHTLLEILATSVIEVGPDVDLPEALAPRAWDELDRLDRDGEMWDWSQPSAFARPTELLLKLARDLGLAERSEDPLTYLRQVNRAIYQSFLYSSAATEVNSPIDEAIAQRSGVCQDFAHVATALLRHQGIPTRYVSGYLFHDGSSGQQSAPNASHAWIEAYLPELGWVGADPTNDTFLADRHIRVAVGRDYADVPPTRGFFKGNVESELAVAVNVSSTAAEPEDDTTALHVVRRRPHSDAASRSHDFFEQQQQQQQ